MSATSLVAFQFESFSIRTLLIANEPWFIASDICSVLLIKNYRDALVKLDSDEKGVALTDTPGGQQKVAIISESGMYTLVLRCRDAVKPGTLPHRFRKWVTNEVLPTIRKTGVYQQHSLSVNTAVVKPNNECRYLVQVFIYDTIFGGCVEMKGKGNTFKSIANGIASDLGYRPTGFVEGTINQAKLSKI